MSQENNKISEFKSQHVQRNIRNCMQKDTHILREPNMQNFANFPQKIKKKKLIVIFCSNNSWIGGSKPVGYETSWGGGHEAHSEDPPTFHQKQFIIYKRKLSDKRGPACN